MFIRNNGPHSWSFVFLNEKGSSGRENTENTMEPSFFYESVSLVILCGTKF